MYDDDIDVYDEGDDIKIENCLNFAHRKQTYITVRHHL